MNNIGNMNNSHSNMVNIIQSFISQINGVQNQEMKNVVVSTDDNVVDELPSTKLEKNCEEKCTICMGSMEENEFVSELKCSHTFHTDCIKPYLKEYTYKCPVCRAEVGKSKVNI